MELKALKYDVADHIATITLSRPKRKNAWTGRMHTEYRWALERADDDADVRVIIVTGDPEGGAFCPGADMQALEGHSERGGYDAGTPHDIAEPGYGVRPEFDQNFAYHFGLSKPVIAAMNGAAAGVGLVLACYADLRFISAGAKLTTAHGRFNMPAEYGLSWLLPRQIGLTHAMDLLLSSRVFTAEEAGELGLVNKVLPAAELMDHAYAYAANLAENIAPGSLRATKWQVYTDQHRDVGAAVLEADTLLEEMVREPDYRAGLRAFLKKEKPEWGG